MGGKGSADASLFDNHVCDFGVLSPLLDHMRRRILRVAEHISKLSAGTLFTHPDLKGTAIRAPYSGHPRTLIYLTTHCSRCHLVHLQSCWPGTLRRAELLSKADVLLYAGRSHVPPPSIGEVVAWVDALARLPNLNVSLAWSTLNAGYQAGAIAPLVDAVRGGWFTLYDWIVRSNPDVSIVDAMPVEARLVQRNTSAVLFRCTGSVRDPNRVLSDFFISRPTAMVARLWGSGNISNAESQTTAVFHNAIESGAAVVWSKNSIDLNTMHLCRVASHGIRHDHRHCNKIGIRNRSRAD